MTFQYLFAKTSLSNDWAAQKVLPLPELLLRLEIRYIVQYSTLCTRLLNQERKARFIRLESGLQSSATVYRYPLTVPITVEQRTVAEAAERTPQSGTPVETCSRYPGSHHRTSRVIYTRVYTVITN